MAASKKKESRIKNSHYTKASRDKQELSGTKITKKRTIAAEKIASTAAVSIPSKKTAKKTGTLTVDVYDVMGKVSEKVSLPEEIFGAKVNRNLMAQAVRVYLANQRAGSASTKTRGEVRGSTRKIYRQKGTGRARHGGARAPIFVHGGTAHGPHPRDFSLALPKKMKKAALFSALSSKLKDGEIKFVSGLSKIEPKTKEMESVLKHLALDGKKRKVLLVANDDLENVTRATKNLSGVSYTSPYRLNTYDVLNYKIVLFMKESVESLRSHFLKTKDA